MAKKYVPSGYQIINLDLTGKTSGTPFTPETEDEKLLHQILSSGKIEKPILIHLITSGYEFHSFGLVVSKNELQIISGAVGSLVSESIYPSADKLVWTETEE